MSNETKRMSERDPLVVRLKYGSYDGPDIMSAWIRIEDQAKRIAELQAENERLRKANESFPVCATHVPDAHKDTGCWLCELEKANALLDEVAEVTRWISVRADPCDVTSRLWAILKKRKESE